MEVVSSKHTAGGRAPCDDDRAHPDSSDRVTTMSAGRFMSLQTQGEPIKVLFVRGILSGLNEISEMGWLTTAYRAAIACAKVHANGLLSTAQHEEEEEEDHRRMLEARLSLIRIMQEYELIMQVVIAAEATALEDAYYVDDVTAFSDVLPCHDQPLHIAGFFTVPPQDIREGDEDAPVVTNPRAGATSGR